MEDQVFEEVVDNHLGIRLTNYGSSEQIQISKSDLIAMFEDVWSAGRRSAFSEAE
jgi:hypothetical protein